MCYILQAGTAHRQTVSLIETSAPSSVFWPLLSSPTPSSSSSSSSSRFRGSSSREEKRGKVVKAVVAQWAAGAAARKHFLCHRGGVSGRGGGGDRDAFLLSGTVRNDRSSQRLILHLVFVGFCFSCAERYLVNLPHLLTTFLCIEGALLTHSLLFCKYLFKAIIWPSWPCSLSLSLSAHELGDGGGC